MPPPITLVSAIQIDSCSRPPAGPSPLPTTHTTPSAPTCRSFVTRDTSHYLTMYLIPLAMLLLVGMPLSGLLPY